MAAVAAVAAVAAASFEKKKKYCLLLTSPGNCTAYLVPGTEVLDRERERK